MRPWGHRKHEANVLGARSPGTRRAPERQTAGAVSQSSARSGSPSRPYSGTRRALQGPTAPHRTPRHRQVGQPGRRPRQPQTPPSPRSPTAPAARTLGASQTSPSRLQGSRPEPPEHRAANGARRGAAASRPRSCTESRTSPARREPRSARTPVPGRRRERNPPVLTSSKRDPTLAVTSSTPAPAAAPFTAMAPGERAEARNGAAGSPGAGAGRCGARAAGGAAGSPRTSAPRRGRAGAPCGCAGRAAPRSALTRRRRRRAAAGTAPAGGGWRRAAAHGRSAGRGGAGGRGGRGGTGRAGLGRAPSATAAPGSAGERRGEGGRGRGRAPATSRRPRVALKRATAAPGDRPAGPGRRSPVWGPALPGPAAGFGAVTPRHNAQNGRALSALPRPRRGVRSNSAGPRGAEGALGGH